MLYLFPQMIMVAVPVGPSEEDELKVNHTIFRG